MAQIPPPGPGPSAAGPSKAPPTGPKALRMNGIIPSGPGSSRGGHAFAHSHGHASLHAQGHSLSAGQAAGYGYSRDRATLLSGAGTGGGGSRRGRGGLHMSFALQQQMHLQQQQQQQQQQHGQQYQQYDSSYAYQQYPEQSAYQYPAGPSTQSSPPRPGPSAAPPASPPPPPPPPPRSSSPISTAPLESHSRSPISITFAPNGSGTSSRPKPPHLDLEHSNGTREGVRKDSSMAIARPPPSPPPPPPDDRPPTPPIETSPTIRRATRAPTSPRPTPPRLPLTPTIKRPPTSPKQRPIAIALPPPPPPPEEPPEPPLISPPGPSRQPTPPRPPSPSRGSKWDVKPPAFHFRDLSVRPPLPNDDEDDDEDEDEDADEDEGSQVEVKTEWKRDALPHRELPPRIPTSRDPTPPPSPPPPPEIPWAAPPWVFERIAGSYTAKLSSDGRKEVSRRTDGMEGGHRIGVTDPRKKWSAAKRSAGQGSSLNRSSFREVTYTWDDHSVGEKPLPPPTAVLVTGLSPLTTSDQIRTFFRPHGRIRELDTKMDPKSGMQLGICWIKFDAPAPAKTGPSLTAHDVAKAVCKACTGHRIGMTPTERIVVVLDGRGLRAQKAIKEEMERRYPKPKPVQPPVQQKPATPIGGLGAATPTSGSATPHAERKLPVPVPVRLHALGPKPVSSSAGATTATSNTTRPPPRPYARPFNSLPRPVGLPTRPAAPTQQFTSSFVDAPFGSRWDERGRDTYVSRARSRSRTRSRSRDRYRGDRDRERGHGHYDYPRSNAYGQSNGHGNGHRNRRYRSPSSHSTDCSTCSDSEDDVDITPRKQPLPKAEDDVKTKEALSKNGRPAIFIDSTVLPLTPANEIYLRDHFKGFRPESVILAPTGFYVLFGDDGAADRARILDGSLIHGRKINFSVKVGHVHELHAKEGGEKGGEVEKGLGPGVGKKGWQMMTIGKKNRTVPVAQAKVMAKSKKTDVTVKKTPTGTPIKVNNRKRVVQSDSEEDEEDIEKGVVPLTTDHVVPSKEGIAEVRMDTDTDADKDITTDAIALRDAAEGESEVEEDEPKTKKRPAAKTKAGAKKKKARIESPAPLVTHIKVDVPAVAEIKLDPVVPVPLSKPAAAAAKPKSVRKKLAADPLERLINDDVLVDEEDAYWLSQALEAKDDSDPMFDDDEDMDALLAEDHPLHHTSGAWRAEGLRKIAPAMKSAYLPQRNRAQAAAEDAGALGPGLATGRSARVTGRRLALDMESHRKTTATAVESDIFAFNQLRIRKKQLRFARSAIEGYGLYAMETIQPGEMVCEYVGELVRSSVADLREARYLKQGIGSSYLFRIDADVVCDATFRGSVSRLINHSCDPSASAKIISINGQSKIVIYARKLLSPGEEILYDYKFPLESDPALRVPCLCGSSLCRGFLN